MGSKLELKNYFKVEIYFKYNDLSDKMLLQFYLKILTQVTVGENEGIESALRRFKRQVSKSGIFADLKRLRHHETPIEKYKRKLQQRRKARRRQVKQS